MYRKAKASHLFCPAVMMISLSAVNMVKFKPQTKPSWRGGGRHRNMMIMEGEGGMTEDCNQPSPPLLDYFAGEVWAIRVW